MSHECAMCAGCPHDGANCPRRQGRRKGVLLINLGTPDASDRASVRRYLAEFLSDPYVIRLPRRLRWLGPALGRFIALVRARRSSEAYESIWWPDGSPLKVITENQCDALRAKLPNDWTVYSAMRYASPSIAATLQRIAHDGVTELIVVPMYPQYSGPTTGTALHDLFDAVEQLGLDLNLEVRNIWYDDAGYIDAQARLIHDEARQRSLTPDNAVLLFSAHSMPQSYIRDGDPYECHVRTSVDLVTQRLGWPVERTRLAFQSKLGPVPWLEPSTQLVLQELADQQENILVCPITFTADCLETLEEIGIGYAEEVEAAGGALHLCPAVNTYEPFVNALVQLIRRGRHSADATRREDEPLLGRAFNAPGDDHATLIDSLVMIGASTPPRFNGHQGPPVRYVPSDVFRSIKRPQSDAVHLLREVQARTGFDECWLWNTCNRFELYGLVGRAPSDRSRPRPGSHPSTEEARLGDEPTDLDDVISAARDHLINGSRRDADTLTVLRGRDAWEHMLRTASGFNSALPGDTEVIDQLHSAHRLARHAGTAGRHTEALISKATRVVTDIRTSLEHGFCNQYCYAAMSRLREQIGIPLSEAKVVTIGGSATSCALAETLTASFDVRSENLTMIYRGEGRKHMIKRLRKVVGSGERLRVNDYTETAVMQAIAEADIVVLGIDRRDAIMTAEHLQPLRDFSEQPLTVIDFNSFPSTQGLEDVAGIDLIAHERIERAVDEYATEIIEDPSFVSAFRQAEDLLAEHIRGQTQGQRRNGVKSSAAEVAPLSASDTLTSGAAS